jgi:SPP1 gp7 family putative phage head morphogenesis protein
MPLPSSKIEKLTKQHRRDLDNNASRATREMASVWSGIEQEMAADILTLAQELSDMSAAGTPIKMWRLAKLRRYTRLLAQLQIELARMGTAAKTHIGQLQQNAAFAGIQNAITYINQITQFQVPSGSGLLGVGFDHLGTDAIANIVAIARGGGPLERLLQRSYPLAANAITDILLTNTALGINPRKTARMAVRQGLSQGLQHILLVARDQQVRAYREAVRQQYDKSGVVSGYRRLAAKNSRTCIACLALDGKVYKTSELMPLHPQDRCTMVPILQGYDPLRFQTGAEWFSKLPPARQKQALGPGRYKLWEQGDITDIMDFVRIIDNETWGPSLQIKPLRLIKT